MEPVGRLGIMGGTFDPIHYGHLVTAEAARVEFDLDVVVFVPSGCPPHKKAYEVSPAEDRYLMTVLATATNPYFRVSRMEIDRPGPSYTVDTVREFQRRCGPHVKLFFITGADATLEIVTWKDSDELLQQCSFIAATRPGYQIEKIEEEVSRIRQRCPNGIHVLEVPALAISSTDIRRRVREGKPIKYLVPESVESHIFKAGLYRAINPEQACMNQV
ncbi:MAG TPA: nicotinate-nucleotide adenylyltransferase [Firmicutes bacterium]|nr:nicotinate-nucleotide adenylyltransferase [Bacillota bacterium]HHY97234.1 nicotinate-nucleotide adenylyltransferase [Bacillota bacterium]